MSKIKTIKTKTNKKTTYILIAKETPFFIFWGIFTLKTAMALAKLGLEYIDNRIGEYPSRLSQVR